MRLKSLLNFDLNNLHKYENISDVLKNLSSVNFKYWIYIKFQRLENYENQIKQAKNSIINNFQGNQTISESKSSKTNTLNASKNIYVKRENSFNEKNHDKVRSLSSKKTPQTQDQFFLEKKNSLKKFCTE